METTPMTFTITIPHFTWWDHPLYVEWKPLSGGSYIEFLKQEHNINVINWEWVPSHIILEFQSAQDYTLWKLHQ